MGHSGNKKKGKKDINEGITSKRWTKIKTEKDSGMRIMYWDLYRNKQLQKIKPITRGSL